MNDNAESQASRAWGTQDRVIEGTNHADGKSGTASSGGFPGGIDIRNLRTDGSGQLGGIVGGIVARMIHDKQDRIREAQACIEWYADEKGRREAELKELESLAELLQGADQDGADQDDEL